MPEIDGFPGGYTITDLHKKWKRGRRAIAEFAGPLYTGELSGSADKRKGAIDRLLCLFEEAWSPSQLGSHVGITYKFPDHYEILNLAASTRSRTYAPVERKEGPRLVSVGGRLGNWSTDQAELRRVLRKTTKAFAVSKTYEEAFSRLASRENRNRWRQYWLGPSRETAWSLLTGGPNYDRNHDAASGEWLSRDIDPRFREIMGWLNEGTEKTTDIDQVWWECLRAVVKPQIDLMLDAQKRIQAGVPVYMEQIEMLKRYSGLGRVELDLIGLDDDGLHEIRMRMAWVVPGPELRCPLVTMSDILLTQPAFALAQELHHSYSRPRYLKRCHAPSCGKAFFTRRKNATTCPGSHGGRKNACSLEWIRYKRYMVKIGRDPDQDWNDTQLKQNFMAYDDSR